MLAGLWVIQATANHYVKQYPITYYSATIPEAKQNYDIYNLKFLAISRATDHWRQYIVG